MSFCTTYPTLDTLYEPELSIMTLLGCEDQLTEPCQGLPYAFDSMETWQFPPLEDIPLDKMLSTVPCYIGGVESYFGIMAPPAIAMPELSPDTGSFTSATSPSETSFMNSESSPRKSPNASSISSEINPNASFDSSNIHVNPNPAQSNNTPSKRPRGRPRKYLADGTSTEPKTDSLDRYRAKNRRASAKCREREKTQTATLQKTVAEQSYRNAELKRSVAQLREELFDLKMSALKHIDCGCHKIQQYNNWKARDVANAWDLDAKDDS